MCMPAICPHVLIANGEWELYTERTVLKNLGPKNLHCNVTATIRNQKVKTLPLTVGSVHTALLWKHKKETSQKYRQQIKDNMATGTLTTLDGGSVSKISRSNLHHGEQCLMRPSGTLSPCSQRHCPGPVQNLTGNTLVRCNCTGFPIHRVHHDQAH